MIMKTKNTKFQIQNTTKYENLHIRVRGLDTIFSKYKKITGKDGYISDKICQINYLINFLNLRLQYKNVFVCDLINICLYELSKTDCLVKTGTFIEARTGMINISPIGRSCSQDQRDEFDKLDKLNNYRTKLVTKISSKWDLFRINSKLYYMN